MAWRSARHAMSFRLEPPGPRTCLRIVEDRREDGARRQHAIATLGRADGPAAPGATASLLASGARLCDRVMLLSALGRDADGPRLPTRRIGGPLLLERLWERTGCGAVIGDLPAGRGFGFDVERAILAAVPHRLSVSGSGRACEGWIEDYARYDGIFVLRTSARVTPPQAMLKYRELLGVETLFRRTKGMLRTRPVYRSSDAAIRGHASCSFLALVPRKELSGRCRAAGFTPGWGGVPRGLDRPQQAEVAQGGKAWEVRTGVGATASALLRACGIAIPPRIQGIPPPAPAAASPPPHRSAGAAPGVVPRAPGSLDFASG